MARWDVQQCLTDTNKILSTGDAGESAWDHDGGAGANRDTIASGWIDTSMTDVIFFEWQLNNDQMGTPTTLAHQLEKIVYAEVSMTSVYGGISGKPFSVMKSPVQFEFGDILENSGALNDNAGTSAYAPGLTIVGVPRGVGTVSMFASFAPNTPGAKAVAGYKTARNGISTVTNLNTYSDDGYQPPTNSLGDYTYSTIELFYSYDATIDYSGAGFENTRTKSYLSNTLTLANKKQAKLKVVNCHAFTKLVDKL